MGLIEEIQRGVGLRLRELGEEGIVVVLHYLKLMEDKPVLDIPPPVSSKDRLKVPF